MARISLSTPVVSACCLALLLPALASAQVHETDIHRAAGATAEALDLSSRPLHAETYAAVPHTDAAVQACRFEAPSQEPEPADSRWLWRLRAFRHLDCVVTLVDAALTDPRTAGDGENDPAQLSREDLERIRTLAWWARDAAARIGQ